MRLSLRGPLGWALAAGLVIAACGGTPTSTTPTASAPAASAAPSGPRLGSFDRPIVLSFTPSQDTQRVTASGNAITASLERATSLKWKVSVPTSYAATIEGMCAGSVDVAFLAPLQMALALDRGCATPFLGALRNDDTGKPSTTYKSQILVRSDSGINDINGLKGKKFAFVDTLSASGYLFPSLKIKEKTSQDPKTFFAANGIIFAGGHDKAALQVYQGAVDGAATFIDVRTSAGMPADIMQKTKVIDTAGPIPNDGAAVRKGFPADLMTQIQKAMADYSQTDAGKKAFKDLYSWDGMQVVDSKFYDPVREAAKLAGIDLAGEAAKTARPVATPSPSPTKAP
ncbi:MAG TPA: phosphate/phosphite/phosphonate ABC transporter substrate-binding protein [Candidatus Limnocylindria bacterium]|nr:phosphate/phosphite/phosphonate ABC transporter substrate-binding protein [Candidatus Limnocylindria bacterium]